MVGGVGEWLEAEFDGTILAFEQGLHKDSAEYDVYVDGKLIGTETRGTRISCQISWSWAFIPSRFPPGIIT